MSDGKPSRGTAELFLIEQGDKLVLGVGVPKEGPFDESDQEAARLIFELALDIRSRMDVR